MSRTIYVDMDDVLCYTARRLLTLIEREFGKRLAYKQITTFDLERACDLQPQEVTTLLNLAHQPDELLSLEPVEGAISVLKQWVASGYEIAIVTGRPPATFEPSCEWLARYQVPYQTFTVVDKYARFTIENTIGITLSELATRRFCWAVEDSLEMASYLAAHMGTPVALLDNPWNRADVQHELIGRYNHWHEIARALPGVARDQ